MGTADPSVQFCPECLRKRRVVTVEFRTKALLLQWPHEMVVCSECGYVLTPQFFMAPRDKDRALKQQELRTLLVSRFNSIKSRLLHFRSPVKRAA
jgi:hypothetical protein